MKELLQMNLDSQEMLKYAIENGMIDMAQIQQKIEMQKREEIIKKHPYKIYQGADKKWYTYLPDDEKGRLLKKRSTKQDLEDMVISFWKQKQEDPTIDAIFHEWIESKVSREEISKSTKDRYERQYEQCFSAFGKRKVKSLSEYDIENFVLDAIHDNELTTKGFSNLRTLVFGIFKLAKKKRLVNFSITEVIGDIEISRKSFRRNHKTDEELVFMADELPKITKYLEENLDIINLGLLLLFKSGLRIGELAGLKKCDISLNSIHVNRTEICYENESGERIFEVRDFPKTEAGIRDVFLPDNCLWILRKINHMNPFGEFAFENHGERIRTYVFRNRLNTICKHAGVVRKSPHKIRKTYGSILIDSGADESFVIEQMGHTDIKTTKDHYYKNRKNDIQKAEYINNVIGL